MSLTSSAQHPQALPAATYDLVAIRPSHASDRNWRFNALSNGLSAKNISLGTLITNAYDIRPGQIVGLPKWAEAEHYDIEARITDPNFAERKRTEAEDHQLLINLLITNFGLVVHKGEKVMSIYQLSLKPGAEKTWSSDYIERPTVGEEPQRTGLLTITKGELVATNAPIADLVAFLSAQLETPIVDRTLLLGRYNFRMKWSSLPLSETDDTNASRSLFTELSPALGLRLSKTQGLAALLFIDNLHHPEYIDQSH